MVGKLQKKYSSIVINTNHAQSVRGQDIGFETTHHNEA
jgi:hypothetical protein